MSLLKCTTTISTSKAVLKWFQHWFSCTAYRNHFFQMFSKRIYFSIDLYVKVSGKATLFLFYFFILGLFRFGDITISIIISVVIFLIVVITVYNVITLRFVVVDSVSLIFLLTYTIWSQHLAKSAIRQWLTWPSQPSRKERTVRNSPKTW